MAATRRLVEKGIAHEEDHFFLSSLSDHSEGDASHVSYSPAFFEEGLAQLFVRTRQAWSSLGSDAGAQLLSVEYWERGAFASLFLMVDRARVFP